MVFVPDQPLTAMMLGHRWVGAAGRAQRPRRRPRLATCCPATSCRRSCSSRSSCSADGASAGLLDRLAARDGRHQRLPLERLRPRAARRSATGRSCSGYAALPWVLGLRPGRPRGAARCRCRGCALTLAVTGLTGSTALVHRGRALVLVLLAWPPGVRRRGSGVGGDRAGGAGRGLAVADPGADPTRRVADRSRRRGRVRRPGRHAARRAAGSVATLAASGTARCGRPSEPTWWSRPSTLVLVVVLPRRRGSGALRRAWGATATALLARRGGGLPAVDRRLAAAARRGDASSDHRRPRRRPAARRAEVRRTRGGCWSRCAPASRRSGPHGMRGRVRGCSRSRRSYCCRASPGACTIG